MINPQIKIKLKIGTVPEVHGAYRQTGEETLSKDSHTHTRVQLQMWLVLPGNGSVL